MKLISLGWIQCLFGLGVEYTVILYIQGVQNVLETYTFLMIMISKLNYTSIEHNICTSYDSVSIFIEGLLQCLKWQLHSCVISQGRSYILRPQFGGSLIFFHCKTHFKGNLALNGWMKENQWCSFQVCMSTHSELQPVKVGRYVVGVLFFLVFPMINL